jgi:RimJ/RimL family protein N-acetyltransferase
VTSSIRWSLTRRGCEAKRAGVRPRRVAVVPASELLSLRVTDDDAVRIEPWGEHDLGLLERLLGDPEMTTHIGGPETSQKIAERQQRYARPAEAGKGRQFRIVHVASGEAVGWVGYWERMWRGDEIYEIGWSVLRSFQGRGIAGRATALAIDAARAERKHRFVHAFPSVANPPSNGICRKLGFTLVEEVPVEYPKGHFMRCNDWRFDLVASDRGSPPPGRDPPGSTTTPS